MSRNLRILKMIKFLLMVLIFILPIASFGAERVRIKDDTETKLKISATGLTHIAVENDRITGVKASTTRFQLDKDEVLGHIYLQPEDNNHEPIQLFINTEKERTLMLLLTPTEKPAGSILLTLEPAQKVAALFEQLQPYEVVVMNLIKALHNDAPLEGYSVEILNLKTKASKDLEVLHMKTYKGQSLRAEVLELNNTQKIPIELKETDFYKPNVRAVSIVNKNLTSKQKTKIYVVRQNG